MSSDKCILLDHGSGGLASQNLVKDIFLALLGNPILNLLEDSAELNIPSGHVAFTTDTYVVDPLFFPGGDIGSLAVHGTVNDLSMKGATPLFLTVGLVLEEGLSISLLKKIVESMAQAASASGIKIVAGDTKVVPRGKADKIFINTSGIGVLPYNYSLGARHIVAGDKVIVSGTVGDHGVTILTQREGLAIDSDLKSDTQPLTGLVSSMLDVAGDKIHAMRDPTRGGLATCICEMAEAASVTVELEEEAIPVRQDVESACEILGLDPLYLANEGKLIAFVSPDMAKDVLNVMLEQDAGRDARIIGEVSEVSSGKSRVLLKTSVGGKRIVEPLTGEPLPRIC